MLRSHGSQDNCSEAATLLLRDNRPDARGAATGSPAEMQRALTAHLSLHRARVDASSRSNIAVPSHTPRNANMSAVTGMKKQKRSLRLTPARRGLFRWSDEGKRKEPNLRPALSLGLGCRAFRHRSGSRHLTQQPPTSDPTASRGPPPGSARQVSCRCYASGRELFAGSNPTGSPPLCRSTPRPTGP
jgi:hypothetical protein